MPSPLSWTASPVRVTSTSRKFIDGAADEAGDEAVVRLVVELLRGVDLLQARRRS